MKIKKLFTLLSIFISFSISAQIINFSDLANLPEARSALTSANDGENIYIVNGFGINTAYASEIFKYDIKENHWSLLTDSTIPKRYASAAIVGQKLYVMNGLLSDGSLNSIMEVIDLNDGTISSTTLYPIPVRAGGIATWEGKIYVFGGTVRPSTYSNKVLEFDPVAVIWKELADMPFAAETKGEIINGKLYVFGGYNGTALNKMAIYDIATNTWEATLEMPVPVSAHATAIVGDKIYLTGDYANLNSLIEFDPMDNSFKVFSENNLQGRRHCASEGIDGQLFVMGGNVTSNIQTSISSVQMAELGVSTSINNIKLIADLEIFPNPTMDVLNFKKEFDFIRVTDAVGKVILVKRGNIQQVVVQHLQKGMYHLMAKKNNNWYEAKWTKM